MQTENSSGGCVIWISTCSCLAKFYYDSHVKGRLMDFFLEAIKKWLVTRQDVWLHIGRHFSALPLPMRERKTIKKWQQNSACSGAPGAGPGHNTWHLYIPAPPRCCRKTYRWQESFESCRRTLTNCLFSRWPYIFCTEPMLIIFLSNS